MLAAFCAWGFQLDAPWNFVAGLGLPAAVIVLWGYFMAPKAARRLPWPLLPAATLAAFLLGAAALLAAGLPALAVAMTAASLAYTATVMVLHRTGTAATAPAAQPAAQAEDAVEPFGR